ncbi:MAG: prolipoprotein diacylglyceryl transferase, partial [Spirochaetes bacterium]
MSYLLYPSWIKPEIIPGLPIRWYGLMYLVAFLIAYWLFKYQIKERKLKVNNDDVLNLFFWSIIGLLIGARAFAVTIYDPTGYYLHHPLQIIVPFARVNGRLIFTGIQGMSYHGGLVGVLTVFIIYCRVKKINTRDWGDMAVAAIPLGYTFGRLGNFINGELYGRVTT